MRRGSIIGQAAAYALAALIASAAAKAADLTELSIEDLMQVEVTLPSRHPESWARAGAAVYVITQDDIRRSGVTNIPDALRLAPGVQVARATSSQWAVGVRGFASRLARSVLVLMDGRSVYNPLFAGTYWEVQDTALEDIDRIEVIRGPGGTLWGANAFNGVINIVTKSAAETQGLVAMGGGGTQERGFGTVRYGGRIGDDLFYRAYGKYFYRSAFPNPSGPEYDQWQAGRGGFRIDWAATAQDRVTVQGDLYTGEAGESVGIAQYEPPFFIETTKPADFSGGNVLGRWTRAFSDTSELVVQTWYEHAFRRDSNFTEERNTFDLDAQHRFALPWNQQLTYGLDWRITGDTSHAVPTIQLRPRSQTLNLVSVFFQDDLWILPDRLRLTVGYKLEYTDYSPVNNQPSGSLWWMPLEKHWLWASISRAVRTPSRIERDLSLTARPLNLAPDDPSLCLPAGSRCLYPRVVANPSFRSETLLAYQLGYRVQPLEQLFLDVATFYNSYDDLLSIDARPPFDEDEPPLPHAVAPFVFANKLHGESWGVELSTTTRPLPWWRLTASYSYLRIRLRADAGSTAVNPQAQDAASPQNQVSVLSTLDLPFSIQLDSFWRYVDTIRVNNQRIPSYVTFDVRAARRLTDSLELSLVGQNLWQPQHREFSPGTAVPRGFYGQLRFQW